MGWSFDAPPSRAGGDGREAAAYVLGFVLGAAAAWALVLRAL